MTGIVAASACALTFAQPSPAHVALDTPKAGLTLAVGSTVSVTWEDTILHDGIGYDLDLVGADATIRSSIASELPTSVHSFDWVVPDVWCVGCSVMVTQLNRVEHDYSDSALINIYGKPSVVESGGSGGAQGGTGGGAGSSLGPDSGGAGNHSAAGFGGTLEGGPLPDASAGTVSSAGSLDAPNSMIPTSAAGGRSSAGKAGPNTNAAAGTSATAAGESSSAGGGTTDAPDESAGQTAAMSADSGGCTIHGRRSSRSPALLVALLPLMCVKRRRRVRVDK